MKKKHRLVVVGFRKNKKGDTYPLTAPTGRRQSIIAAQRFKSVLPEVPHPSPVDLLQVTPHIADEDLQSAQSQAAVVEISRFLGTYLSGFPDAAVYPNATGAEEYSCEEDGTIHVPEWGKYQVGVQGLNKWRIYRGGLWHETQHLKYSPKDLWTYYADALEKDVSNIVEDRRIESAGVKWHTGYLPEKIYSDAYAYAIRPSVEDLWNRYEQAQNDFVAGNLSREHVDTALFDVRREALLQNVIGGFQKGKLPQAEQARIDDVSKTVIKSIGQLNETVEANGWSPRDSSDSKKIMDGVDKIVQYAISSLSLKTLAKNKNFSDQTDWDQTFSPEVSRDARGGSSQEAHRQKVQADIDEFFGKKRREQQDKQGQDSGQGEGQKKKDDKQGSGLSQGKDRKKKKGEKEGSSSGQQGKEGKEGGKAGSGNGAGQHPTAEELDAAQNGSADIIAEFKNIQQGTGFETPEGLNRGWEPVIASLPTGGYDDIVFKRDMQKRMRDWHSGRKVEVEKSGQILNVGAFVSSHGKKSFYRIEQKSIKGQKYVFLLDFSVSQKSREDAYKKAMINTVETLAGVGGKVAVFVFGGTENGQSGFLRVKTFEQGLWKPSDSGRLAGLTASLGYTPTGTAYSKLTSYIAKHRPQYFVTVTDGSPSDRTVTQDKVRELKRKTKMVAFGIPESASNEDREDMAQTLKDFRYDKTFVATVDEIPTKIVDLIAPVDT